MFLLTLFFLAVAEREDTALLQSRSSHYHAVSAATWRRAVNKSAPEATAVVPTTEQVAKAMKAHEEVAQREPERQLPSCPCGSKELAAGALQGAFKEERSL